MTVAAPNRVPAPDAAAQLAAADAALRAADSTAFPVHHRILKRVIIQDLGLTGLGLNVPHRKGWVLTASRAQQLLEPDEIGLATFDALPHQVILIARPEDEELERLSSAELRGRYWRLLFHAAIHRELDEALEEGRLSDAVVRSHIETLGQVAFDEAEDVLRREKFLPHEDSRTATFIEFVAVYLELLCFSPEWLPSYFPSMEPSQNVVKLLSTLIDARALIETTRIEGAPISPIERTELFPTAPEPDWKTDDGYQNRKPRSYHRLVAKAKRESSRGNNARSARSWLMASHQAPELLSGESLLGARREIQNLTTRLQAALGFDDAEADEWLELLCTLLSAARPGFWNPDARLLYDLQKVALDHERDVFVIDAWRTIRTFGRIPLRRKLEYQREVLMCRHLRTAIRRLTSSRISGNDRERLTGLLHRAAEAAERQLRSRLRPLLQAAIDDVGLIPANVPEKIARQKVVEEWLDVIAERGFLTLGYLRDAISRNQLKLRDLTDRDLLTGGPLLMLDRQLAKTLDGVYQRGEFYLRWLQRLSGAGFGTRLGRWLTLFVIVPFGGAYVALEGVDHLWNAVAHFTRLVPEFHLISKAGPHGEAAGLDQAASLFVLAAVGVFFLGLIHSLTLRDLVRRLLHSFFTVLKGVLFDLPAYLLKQPAIRVVLRSRPVVMFRRHLLFPLFVSTIAWWLIPSGTWTTEYAWPLRSMLFITSMVLLNSRMGRSVEAATAEMFEWTWYTVRVRILVALFEGIMDFFKRVTEWIERLLYAVDEWLRFKTGETEATLAIKAVLGLIWSVVAYAVRFCVNLLIEPQINPIKHFPVVTVSHKIILPMQPLLARLLVPTLGTAWGQTLAGAIIFGTPGIFGFLVWELKGNWQLYAANRSPKLFPAPIGSHGETVVNLVRPGFHSGALPKLYARLRKAWRRHDADGRRVALARCHAQLHHIERSTAHFIDRELIQLLAHACGFEDGELTVGEVHLTANSIGIELNSARHPDRPLKITLAEQSGYLVAGLENIGWIESVNEECRRACDRALAGFYALCGVDLVREHLVASLKHRFWSYDIASAGLVVWPEKSFETEIVYAFTDAKTLVPRPSRVAERFQLPRLDPNELFFSRIGIRWADWIAAWGPSDPKMPGNAQAIPHVLPQHG